jgi:predicted ribosomally synthesized peptide with SipW-like signal peptide
MNKRLPLGLLAILLIVLLAGIGVAYGLWSETLTIDGTVETGEVDVMFEWVEKSEMVSINGAAPVAEPTSPIDKSGAANCITEIEDLGTDEETLVVEVTGAYPSWHCIVEFDVKSVGSVPVHVYEPEADVDTPAWADLDCNYKPAHGIDPLVGFEQLHDGQFIECKLTIHFTNDDEVDEDATYSFLYTIEAVQWNEQPAH